MRYSSIVVALAASAAAVPAPAAGPKPPKSKEFYIAFTVGGTGSDATYVSANAQFNGTADELVLVAERLSVYPGTPAYFNASSSSPEGIALNFDLTDSKDPNIKRGIYGAQAPNFGDAYGQAGNVVAIPGYQQSAWGANNGTIYHHLYSGVNGFFACQDTVNGQAATVLKFGVYQSNTQPPKGCKATRVVQNFNVPGGLQPSQ